MNTKRSLVVVMMLAMVACVVSPAAADIIGFTPVGGSTTSTGATWSYYYKFKVNSPIMVTQLGLFNDTNGATGFSPGTNASVAIWRESDGAQMALAPMASTDTPVLTGTEKYCVWKPVTYALLPIGTYRASYWASAGTREGMWYNCSSYPAGSSSVTHVNSQGYGGPSSTSHDYPNSGTYTSYSGGLFGVDFQYLETGTLVIEKYFDAAADGSISGDSLLGGWSFHVTGTGYDKWFTDGDGNPLDGIITITGLAVGDYTVVETPQDGYYCSYDTDGVTLGTVLATITGGGITYARFGNAVPEPAGLGLVGMALLALKRRRK